MTDTITHKTDPNTENPAGEDVANRPRIAMLSIHGYVSPHPPLGATDTGGQVVYVLELSRKLASLGYAVDIWTRRFDGQPVEEQVAPGVRILRVACGPAGFVRKEVMHRCIPEWCDNALNLIRSQSLKYEFINSHYWDAGLAGRTLSRALGVKHFHTPHSLGMAKRRQMQASALPQEPYNFPVRIDSERSLYADSDAVIATTQEMADMIVHDYEAPLSRVTMIPPGYDDARFFPVGEASRRVLRRRLGFEGTVFFSLGRLARTKGFDLLIRAFAVAAKRIPDARLALGVGGDDLSPSQQALLEELKATAREAGVEGKVDFLGYIPHHRTVDYYRAADVFVLSSRVEPFGMTAVEAMACGTPCVVTVHGGLCQSLTFGRNALFADPMDAEDLGITMIKPMKHPRLRSRLSRMGAYRARSLFTWTGIAQNLVALADGNAAEDAGFIENEWDEPANDIE